MENELVFVVFSIGSEQYALPVSHVTEVLQTPQITPLPNPTSILEGVINLRGKIITCMDLGKILEVSGGERKAVLITDLEANLIGLRVDEVLEVMSCDQTKISLPPTGIEKEGVVEGIIQEQNRVIFVLSLEGISKKLGFQLGRMAA